MRPRPEDRGEPRYAAALAVPGGSFNAATARRPWRTLVLRAFSMVHVRLQCGHGPKTVENHYGHRSGTSTPAELQCGHGPKTVENRDSGVTPDSINGASMRPRPEDRGERDAMTQDVDSGASFNAATARRPWRTRTAVTGTLAHASMRPRPEDRGEPDGKLIRPRRARLQCGHGPKTVENDRSARVDQPDLASMRPRPEDRGEPGRSCGVVRGRSFNAATARRPWRTHVAGYCPLWLTRASMRPRPEDRGELAMPMSECGGASASMRPRPEDRGELGRG